MMLDYEWGNSAAAAAAMMLFGDESGGGGGDPGATDERALAMFDHYAGHGIGGASAGDCIADYFAPPPQQLTAAALFSPTPSSSSTCDARYGLALQPAPSRIGLNLGVRTYFSSSLPGESSGLAPGRVTRRRVRTARCQAEGCGADLTHAKHYHRRHKVCEFHSKASVVIAAGVSQRFCQQCSRFHVLSEFDHGKRSCRKRLADHNRRRRKSQDLTPTTITQSNNNGSTITTADGGANSTASPQKLEMLFFTTSSSSSTAPPPFARCKPETNASIMAPNVPSSPAPALHYSSPTKMALGLGCGGVVTLQTGLSASSSTETSPPSVSFLSQLGEFRSGHEQRFGGWDDGEDGCSIRELFQSK